MPYVHSCSCGKKTKVPDKYAGKRVKCSQCGAPIQVPAPEESELSLKPLDEEAPAAVAAPAAARTAKTKAKKQARPGTDPLILQDEPETAPPPPPGMRQMHKKSKAQEEFEARQEAEEAMVMSPFGAIAKSFVYPLTPGGIVFIIFAAAAAFASQFLWIFGYFVWVAAYFGGWMYTLRTAAMGPTQRLEFPPNVFGEMLGSGFRYFLVTLIVTLPLTITSCATAIIAAGAIGASQMEVEVLDNDMAGREALIQQKRMKEEQIAAVSRRGLTPKQREQYITPLREDIARLNEEIAALEARIVADGGTLEEVVEPETEEGESAEEEAASATPEAIRALDMLAGVGVLLLVVFLVELAVALAYFPMAVACVGAWDSIWLANPVAVFMNILRIPGDYAVCAIFFSFAFFGSWILLFILNGMAALIDPFFGPTIAAPVIYGIIYYIMTVACTNLGFMAFRNRDALGL